MKQKTLFTCCAVIAAAAFIPASARSATELRIMNPRSASSTTTAEYVNVLGSFDKDASVTVQGQPARVMPTAIFVRDLVPLSLGENSIVIQARTQGGTTQTKTLKVTREQPEKKQPVTNRAVIDAKSVLPAQYVAVLIGEPIEFAVSGTAGAQAEVELGSGRRYPLSEVIEGTTPTGLYRAAVVLSQVQPSTTFTLRIKAKDGLKFEGAQSAQHHAESRLEVWDPHELRLRMVKDDFGQVLYGLHDVRLGGPFLTELSSGTIVRVTGQQGRNVRVQLARNTEGWMSEEDLTVAGLPAGASVPHAAFTNLSVSGNQEFDTITIPFTQRVPFAINPTTGPGGNARIDVDFYGAHNAATWISHRPEAKVVREVTVEQIASDHLRLHADLRERQLWGFRHEVTTNTLVIHVRRAPAIASPPDSPIKGLVIAVEAGHGGSRDLGARGVTGSAEKDITRLTADTLVDLLTSAGAKAVNVRVGDEPISLSRKVQRALDANAHLYISVHCNSASNDRGYLRVSGVSTYYKFSNSFDLSDMIHTRLLQNLKIADFGNVGNFNYYPLRAATWMPSMLIEQAFISNPEDEAKLLDPAFRLKIAESAVQGIEDFLNSVRKEKDPK